MAWSPSASKSHSFRAKQVLVGLTAADEPGPGTRHQDLGSAGPGVVVGGHDNPVRARREDRQQGAAAERRQGAILGQKVATLAHGSDHVPGLGPLDRQELTRHARGDEIARREAALVEEALLAHPVVVEHLREVARSVIVKDDDDEVVLLEAIFQPQDAGHRRAG